MERNAQSQPDRLPRLASLLRTQSRLPAKAPRPHQRSLRVFAVTGEGLLA
jgi:hypothetical protein